MEKIENKQLAYEEPLLEVVHLTEKDIITTSGDGFEDEDEDSEEDEDDDLLFYSVECPGCGFTLTVDEDTMLGGSFECPECGEVIDFSKAKVEEVIFDEEDGPDEE